MPARRRPRTLTTLLAAALALPLLAGPAGAGGARPVWTLKPARGMVGDSLAFSPSGDRLAYIHTDLATFLDIVVVKTDGFEAALKIAVKDVSRIPVWLRFTADGKGLLYTWMEGYTGVQSVSLYDAGSGKARRTIGPATYARLAEPEPAREPLAQRAGLPARAAAPPPSPSSSTTRPPSSRSAGGARGWWWAPIAPSSAPPCGSCTGRRGASA